MGRSHALAYHRIEDFEIAGIVTRSAESRGKLNQELGGGYQEFGDFFAALNATRPEVVSISTYPDTHMKYAQAALNLGAHVFIEKPLAETVPEAEVLIAEAQKHDRKMVIGYILRHHPSWKKFIEVAKTLGKPLVMRMNLNQQSAGNEWQTHKHLMSSISPIVDCGVHYVDVMCQMTGTRPVRVSGIGARLTDELPEGKINYGQLQVMFADGSVGWYECGWGPMMSETAFFVKDVVGPQGCVSIDAPKAGGDKTSSDVDSHTKTESLRLHYGELDAEGKFVKPDEWISMEDEPNHDELCHREQLHLLQAIQNDLDLTSDYDDAINSMRIVAAADQSYREGRTIDL